MIGKIAGGIIGFLVGGPVGAAAGVAIGAGMDGDLTPSNSLIQPSKNTTVPSAPESIPATHTPETNIAYETLQCRVAGVTFENRQELIARLNIGSEVYLTRDPNNKFDANAVAVLNDSYQIVGYIPKDIAAKVVNNIALGEYKKAIVINKLGGNGLSYGIEIREQIPCAFNADNSASTISSETTVPLANSESVCHNQSNLAENNESDELLYYTLSSDEITNNRFTNNNFYIGQTLYIQRMNIKDEGGSYVAEIKKHSGDVYNKLVNSKYSGIKATVTAIHGGGIHMIHGVTISFRLSDKVTPPTHPIVAQQLRQAEINRRVREKHLRDEEIRKQNARQDEEFWREY